MPGVMNKWSPKTIIFSLFNKYLLKKNIRILLYNLVYIQTYFFFIILSICC